MRIAFLAHVVLALALPVAAAQAPAATPPAAPAAPAAAAGQRRRRPPHGAASPAPAPAEAYTYQPDGRRDPFLNLLGTGAELRATGKRADGAGRHDASRKSRSAASWRAAAR